MSINMYGSGDDIISFYGDVYDELYPNSNEWTFVAFSNGFLAKIKYDGEWTIKVVQSVPGIKFELMPVGKVDEDEFNDYTDVLTIEDDIAWVVVGEKA